MPRSPTDCIKMAEEAIETAEHAETEVQRDVMLKIAHQWMRLAEHVSECDRLTGPDRREAAHKP